jgi:hypothetical protein
LEAI